MHLDDGFIQSDLQRKRIIKKQIYNKQLQYQEAARPPRLGQLSAVQEIKKKSGGHAWEEKEVNDKYS